MTEAILETICKIVVTLLEAISPFAGPSKPTDKPGVPQSPLRAEGPNPRERMTPVLTWAQVVLIIFVGAVLMLQVRPTKVVALEKLNCVAWRVDCRLK